MSQTTTIQIKGMHCGACEKVISRRLSKLPGVSGVTVSPQQNTAQIVADREISHQEVSDTLAGTEYQVINSI
jgi:copper chaperone CopZ